MSLLLLPKANLKKEIQNKHIKDYLFLTLHDSTVTKKHIIFYYKGLHVEFLYWLYYILLKK